MPSSTPQTTTSSSVLVAEDDPHLRDSLARVLAYEGYRVRLAVDGAEALASVLEAPPDVIVLDVMMPNVDGLTACRRLRDRGDRTPVLMLTARHEVGDRVAGLDAGADDYLVKPYALDELLARLRALLRRTSVTGDEGVLRVGDLVVDPLRRQAWRGSRAVELTKTEFDLLELLLYNAGIGGGGGPGNGPGSGRPGFDLGPGPGGDREGGGPLIGLDAVTQVLDANGAVISSVAGQPALPIDGRDRALARRGGQPRLRDV